MAKLHLTIVDQDRDYVENLVRFITDTYSRQFSLSFFTERKPFVDFLERALSQKESTPDLILSGIDFDEGNYPPDSMPPVAYLVGQKFEINSKNQIDKRRIFKYQRGDELINQALLIIDKICINECSRVKGLQKARVTAVCSGASGAGKTVTAMGLSIQAAWANKRVFYLNLEFLSSAELFLSGEQKESLSHVLYHLKNTKTNLAIRLNSAKCVDPWFKIHYFKEPDSFLDLQEDVSAELRLLVHELAFGGQYDCIYIDMSSSLDLNYLAVLEECDEILLLCTQDIIAIKKTKKLLRQFELLERGKGLKLLEKVNLILNKYEKIGNESGDMRICGHIIVQKIPQVAGLILPHAIKYRLDMNSAFGTAIHELARRFK